MRDRIMDELLERHGEVARAQALVDATLAGRGSLVAFVGPPRNRQDTPARVACCVCPGGGRRRFSRRASGFERGFAFAIARQLLAPAVAGLTANERRAVLDGSAALGAAAIDLDGAGGADGADGAAADSLFSGVHGLYWLAANLSERRPLVVALDDAQWADAESCGGSGTWRGDSRACRS